MKTEAQQLVESSIQQAFVAGKRANKMEHERNEARRKAGVAKRRWRERVKQLERTNSALSDQVAKLTMECERLAKFSKALKALPEGTILIKEKDSVGAAVPA